MRDGRQLSLFENVEAAIALSTALHREPQGESEPASDRVLEQRLLCQSFAAGDSSLHSLAPYDHKTHSAMAQVLIDLYSQPGQVVLDPFCGSGVIPLEAVLSDRVAWSSDLNPYAYALTRGKLDAPRSQRLALQQVTQLIAAMTAMLPDIATEMAAVPDWVRDFFHPDTLREIVAARQVLRVQSPAQPQSHYFLTACLLGILQHVRADTLSYPTDPEVPFLRSVTYGIAEFPELYGYRDLRSRLISKVKRVYRRHGLSNRWDQRLYQVWHSSSTELAIKPNSVHAIITHPPHAHAFDYTRNHRLRLWLLGDDPAPTIQAALMGANRLHPNATDEEQMTRCLQEMAAVLKPEGYCVLILTEAVSPGLTATWLDWVETATANQLQLQTIHTDTAPRKRLQSKAGDRIIVLRKAAEA